jgi:hypothetical protein
VSLPPSKTIKSKKSFGNLRKKMSRRSDSPPAGEPAPPVPPMPTAVDPAVKERIQSAVKQAREKVLKRFEEDEIRHEQTTISARQNLIASLKAKPDKTPQLLRLIEKMEAEEEKCQMRLAAEAEAGAPKQPQQSLTDGPKLRDTLAMQQGFNVQPVRPALSKLNIAAANAFASQAPVSRHEVEAEASQTGNQPLVNSPIPMAAIHPALRPQKVDNDSAGGTSASSSTLLNQSWPGADWSATATPTLDDVMVGRLTQATEGLVVQGPETNYGQPLNADEAWAEKIRTIRISRMAEMFGLGEPATASAIRTTGGKGKARKESFASGGHASSASGGSTCNHALGQDLNARSGTYGTRSAAGIPTCSVCGIPIGHVRSADDKNPLVACATASGNPFDEPGANYLSPAPLSEGAKKALTAMGVRLPGTPPAAAGMPPALGALGIALRSPVQPLPSPIRVAPPQASAERPFASLFRSGRLAGAVDGQGTDDSEEDRKSTGGGAVAEVAQDAGPYRVDAARRAKIHDELMEALEKYWDGVREAGATLKTPTRVAMRDVLATVERVAMQEGGYDTPEELNAFLFAEPAEGEDREVSVRREETKVKLAFVTAWLDRAEREGW